MPRLTGGQALVESLIAHGVDTAFGVISVHTMDFFDALYDAQDRIRFIGTRHESAAAYMAYGYAQVTGKPGVLVTSTGPGAGNAVGALGEAHAGSIPIVHITTDVAPHLRNSGKGEIHEPKDQDAMFRSVTGWGIFVPGAAGIPDGVGEAFTYLRSRKPRPVDLEIATTALGEEDDIELTGPRPASRPLPDEGALAEAAARLSRSDRPVILAGGGAITGDACEELVRLAEGVGASVATTYGGKGAISDDHPLAVGCIRGGRVYGENPLFDLVRQSDCVLVAGSRLSYSITAAAGLKLPAGLIHLDIDPDVFDKNYPAEVKLRGDVKAGLHRLGQLIGQNGRSASAQEEGFARAGAARAAQRRSLEESGPAQQRVIDALRAAMPRDTIVSADANIPAYWAVRGLPVYGPRSYVSVHAWSSIGMAFPAGIGAKAGARDRPVVVIHGDGGFQFNLQELATAVQYDLPLTLLVFNDNGWGILRRNQERVRRGRRYATDLVNPDFLKLADAYGVQSARVRTVADLQSEVSDSIASSAFRLIEVETPDGFESLF